MRAAMKYQSFSSRRLGWFVALVVAFGGLMLFALRPAQAIDPETVAATIEVVEKVIKTLSTSRSVVVEVDNDTGETLLISWAKLFERSG
jgi:hypothetical protein